MELKTKEVLVWEIRGYRFIGEKFIRFVEGRSELLGEVVGLRKVMVWFGWMTSQAYTP